MKGSTAVGTTGVRHRRVFLNLTGRNSGTYDSPQAFAEEAKRLGVSRKVHAIVAVPGDVIMFVTAPHRIKKERGVTFNPLAFGYCVVTGYAIYPKTQHARTALTNALKTAVEEGIATVEEVDEFVSRRCGYYRVGRRVVVSDFSAFKRLLLDAWRKELHTLPKEQRESHNFLRDFDFLVQGKDFNLIEPPLELPFGIKYKRGLRLVKPDELELLLNTLKWRSGEAAVDAFFGERPNQPAILLELTEYVQQAMNTTPKGVGRRRQRRRKTTEQPTPIPEPELEPEPTPLSAISEPKPPDQPEPAHPASACVLCGKPTEGTVLCQECKDAALRKLGMVTTSS